MTRATSLFGALALTALFAATSAGAQVLLPAIPPEMGTAIPARPYGVVPYRCEAPVYNFYHGAWYGGEPPAVYRGFAYRAYHRYAAWRRLP